jgi:uncharacterized protein YidB (DUF937 family)
MGFLDGVKKAVGMQPGGSSQGGIDEHVLSLVKGPGGIAGLVEQFKSKGLGEVISSWISTGKNLPISAEQITKVLGSGKIAEIAQKVGLSAKDVSKRLASLLPRVIDGLTPNGNVPAGGALEQGLSSLKQKLQGK